MKRGLRISGLLLLAALLALAIPMAELALAGRTADKGDTGGKASAEYLIRKYDALVHQSAPNEGQSTPTIDFAKCPDNRAGIFAADDDIISATKAEMGADYRWTPYRGYLDLEGQYQRATWDQYFLKTRAEYLAKSETPFRLGVLAQCLDDSIIGGFCKAKVEEKLKKGGLLVEKGQRVPDQLADMEIAIIQRSRQSICVYLDGVAAKRGP